MTNVTSAYTVWMWHDHSTIIKYKVVTLFQCWIFSIQNELDMLCWSWIIFILTSFLSIPIKGRSQCYVHFISINYLKKYCAGKAYTYGRLQYAVETISHLEVKLPIHYKYMLVLSFPIIWYDLFTTKSLLHGFDCSITLYLPHECSMFYITMQV